jgi:predicted MFS family arabinose efflux permease
MVVSLTTRFRGGIIAPILSLFIRRQGLSITQIGFLRTAGMLGWLIFEPIMGVVADRFRKRFMVAIAVIGSTGIYVLYPMASEFIHFALLAFGMSSVMSAYAISVKALTAELLPPESRGRTYGRFLAVISLGGVVAPFLGGYISQVLNYSYPFYIAACIGVITLVAILLMGYDDKTETVSSGEDGGWQDVLTKNILSIFLIRGLYLFNMIFRQHFLPIYLNESPNFLASEAQIGGYLTIIGITTASSQFFLGDLNDRLGSRMMIFTSVALLGGSYLGLIFLRGLIPLYLLALLQGVLLAGADISMMINLMSVMPQGRTGMVMGLYSESENIGGMIASPSLGYVYQEMGSTQSIYLLSGILMASSLLAGVILKDKE